MMATESGERLIVQHLGDKILLDDDADGEWQEGVNLLSKCNPFFGRRSSGELRLNVRTLQALSYNRRNVHGSPLPIRLTQYEVNAFFRSGQDGACHLNTAPGDPLAAYLRYSLIRHH